MEKNPQNKTEKGKLCNIYFENRTRMQVLISQNSTRQKGHTLSPQNLGALLKFCEVISPAIFVFPEPNAVASHPEGAMLQMAYENWLLSFCLTHRALQAGL